MSLWHMLAVHIRLQLLNLLNDCAPFDSFIASEQPTSVPRPDGPTRHAVDADPDGDRKYSSCQLASFRAKASLTVGNREIDSWLAAGGHWAPP